MRKQIRKISISFLAAATLSTTFVMGTTANAANLGTGSQGVLADSGYSVDEMLVYAMEDEYLAQAEYNTIMNTFGVQRPFSNIIQAEATHISLLTPLFLTYGIELPQKNWDSLVSVPESIDAAYAIGIQAEENNIAMYDTFLKEELPEDVKEVFEDLQNSSKNHLAAFQRVSERSVYREARQGTVSNEIGQNRSYDSTSGGRGQGNRVGYDYQYNCMID